MRRRWIVAAFTLVGLMAAAVYCGWAAAEEGGAEVTGNLTVITSERLLFDYKKQYALFEEDVVVTDPELKLTADTMTVRFNEAGDVSLIVAKGNVTIEQADKVATSGLATYNVEQGKITLEENPRVKRGKDLLEGVIITFWRDDNKMICEPQARLVIYPEKGGTRDQLFGD